VHEWLHVAILASTLLGAAGLLTVVMWPLVTDQPLVPAARNVLLALIALGAVLLVVEWRLVH
jgi:ABC-type bacteriocin/lantibiotic exporter with double-glycine peptidase domain